MGFWKENFILSAQFGVKSKLLVNIELLKSLKWHQVRWGHDDLKRVLVSGCSSVGILALVSDTARPRGQDELRNEKPPRLRPARSYQARGVVTWLVSMAWTALGWEEGEAELVVETHLEVLFALFC